MSKVLNIAWLFIALVIYVTPVEGQKNKKIEKKKRTSFFGNIFTQLKSSITVSKEDSAAKATVINGKSVIPYNEHRGKVIRSITTQEIGFERVFTDTSKFISYYGTRVLNALHTDTYDWVIRDNLFMKVGDRVNPYVLSDNERYLRSLEFIQDARIFVRPIKNQPDSVDVVVITKDLFSITGSADFSGTDRQKVTVAESNLAGAGQKIQFTGLRDMNRQPNLDYEMLYSKNSIAHSFINGTLGYSHIAGSPAGSDNVESIFLSLNRPLYSPYSRLAGGFDLAFNDAKNTLASPDSLFFDFKNVNVDAWGGYNFGVNRLLENDKHRKRAFVALRYLNRTFQHQPFQVKGFNSFFNDRKALLGEVTFFRQEFYKTNYIYGFGTTEDVPYGYNLAVTGGWYKQLELERPYFGVNANRYIATEKGKFMQFYFRSGFFLNKGQWEDVTVLAGGSMFGRLHVFKKFKMRQYVKYNFSRIFNRTTYDPLQINNALGLRYFSSDTSKGTQRMSLYTETFFFAKYKLLGFLMAPFVFGDAAMLKPEGKPFFTSDIYTSVGAGLRTRNVNLIFGTAEFRFIFFPRKSNDTNSFKISFTGDISFRYNSNYIRKPDFIDVNNEDTGSFY